VLDVLHLKGQAEASERQEDPGGGIWYEAAVAAPLAPEDVDLPTEFEVSQNDEDLWVTGPDPIEDGRWCIVIISPIGESKPTTIPLAQPAVRVYVTCGWTGSRP